MSIRSLWNQKPVLAGRWTVKDIVQGKAIRHPSHPLFVHFPSALFPAAFLFDVISRLDADLTWTRAAFYDIALGLAISALAAVTGLVDYLPMISGSRKKKVGTYHLLGELTLVTLLAASFVVRAFDFDAEQTPLVALALAGLGTVALGIGNYFGGELVYRQGMRVSVDDL